MQKKKKYAVSRSFWKDGVLYQPGSEVWLFDSEAKYRGHVLTDPDATAAPAHAAPADEPSASADAPNAVEVVEVPVRRKRSKREAGAEYGKAQN